MRHKKASGVAKMANSRWSAGFTRLANLGFSVGDARWRLQGSYSALKRGPRCGPRTFGTDPPEPRVGRRSVQPWASHRQHPWC